MNDHNDHHGWRRRRSETNRLRVLGMLPKYHVRPRNLATELREEAEQQTEVEKGKLDEIANDCDARRSERPSQLDS